MTNDKSEKAYLRVFLGDMIPLASSSRITLLEEAFSFQWRS
jgi:hypothetical protein